MLYYSATYDGIATYDQKNNYLYFSSDYEASFVYGLDIATKEILPPISINSDAVASYAPLSSHFFFLINIHIHIHIFCLFVLIFVLELIGMALTDNF